MTWIVLWIPDQDNRLGEYESQIKAAWSDEQVQEAAGGLKKSSDVIAKALIHAYVGQFLPQPLRDAL